MRIAIVSGGGSTDYGQAFQDFKRLCLDDLDKRATIIILGDSRGCLSLPAALCYDQTRPRHP
ncbi:MAG: hypothetical protein OXE40_07645 [Gammaproteobacteria bacterium]|nr:hypothetical protein [Gammaproteobacteria bacterium]